MVPSHGLRAGAASRSLLLLAFLALAILGVLALFLRTAAPDPGGGAPLEARADLAQVPEPGLSDVPEGARTLDSRDRAARTDGEQLGVRLSGAGRLEGRVVERASGAGVPGVRVELTPLPPAATTLAERVLSFLGLAPALPERVRPVAAAVSGTGGAFAFSGVRPGSWFVEARGPYHAPDGAVRARVLASGAGGPLDVHVRSGGRVLGRVLAPDGAPAASARVELIGGPGRWIEDAASGDLRLFEAICDPQGAFAIDGVPPADGYDLSAAGPGFAVTHVLDVAVAAGKDTELEIRARSGGSIAGRVLSSRGAEAPEPLAGAHVAAIPRGLRDLLLVGEVLATTHCVTAADGSFRMTHVPPGEVDLATIAPGHLPTLGCRTAVAEGATAAAADILLSPGTMLRGRIVDDSGAPVAGVQVLWNPLEDRDVPDESVSFAAAFAHTMPGVVFPQSAADGRFEAGPMGGEAPWSLHLSKLGFGDHQENVSAEQAKEEITIVLSRGGSVEGLVVDAATSQPVPIFTVWTADAIETESGSPGSWNPFTGGRLFEDEQGRFHLDSVTAGSTELRISSPGYAQATVSVEVPAGGAVRDVKVELKKGGILRGVVVDEELRPVAGAHVVAVGGKGDDGGPDAADDGDLAASFPPALMGFAAGLGLLADREAMSGEQGEFELTGVAGGNCRVRAFHRDHAGGTSPPLALEEGGTLEGVRVEMRAGGGVTGTVSDRHGRPVAGAIVIALAPMALGGMAGDAAMGALYQGHSDAQGAYRISHVAAGSYFLVVTRGDEALHPLSFVGRLNFDMVTVPDGQTVRYDLVDTSAGACRVFGTVLDAGKPVAGGMLMAMGFEGRGALGVDMKIARLSPEGSFEFPGLVPGRWQITLQDSPSGGGADVRMLIEVPDQPEYHVDLMLPEAGLQGSVVDDATGEPVAHAEVRARPLGAPKLKGLLALAIRGEESASRTTSDEEGRFEFGRLCAAEYEVTVRPPGGKQNRKRWAPPEPFVVEVREGRIERGCVLRLSPPLTLVGVVKGEQGEPIEDARVLVRRQDREDARGERARTDGKGRFEVDGLAPGLYVVSATEREHAGATLRDVKVERSAGAAGEVEVRLQRGVAVSVRVFGSDGQPVSGARATLYRGEADSDLDVADADRVLEGLFKGEGASDAEGRIEMGRFAPGEYRLEVERGLSTMTEPRVTIRGDRAEVELRADLP